MKTLRARVLLPPAARSRGDGVCRGRAPGACRGDLPARCRCVDEDGEPVLGPDGQPIIEVVTDLPASERFFAGGDTSVRGYALDRLGIPFQTIDANGFPTGGNAVFVLNAELRVPVDRRPGRGRLHGRGPGLQPRQRFRLRRRSSPPQGWACDTCRPSGRFASTSASSWIADDCQRRAGASDRAAYQPGAGLLNCRLQIADCRLRNCADCAQGFRIASRVLGARPRGVLLCAASAGAQVIDRVLATVDGHLVTLSDVRATTTLGLTPAAPAPARRRGAGPVDRAAARAAGSGSLRAAGAGRRRGRRTCGRGACAAGHARRGARDAGAAGDRPGVGARWVRDDLRIQAYTEQRFAGSLEPTGDELENYYREHAGRVRARRARADAPSRPARWRAST